MGPSAQAWALGRHSERRGHPPPTLGRPSTRSRGAGAPGVTSTWLTWGCAHFSPTALEKETGGPQPQGRPPVCALPPCPPAAGPPPASVLGPLRPEPHS